MQNEYWINAEDTIIAVGAAWDSFAGENSGQDVVSDRVVGRSLWEFIAGDTTKMWLSSILILARIRNQPVSRPYRCDSAKVKRFMNLEITKTSDGILHLRHSVVRVEPMSSSRRFTSAVTAGKMLQRCSVCNRVNTSTGWTEPEDMSSSVGCDIVVIYAVCADCMRYLPQ